MNFLKSIIWVKISDLLSSFKLDLETNFAIVLGAVARQSWPYMDI